MSGAVQGAWLADMGVVQDWPHSCTGQGEEAAQHWLVMETAWAQDGRINVLGLHSEELFLGV